MKTIPTIVLWLVKIHYSLIVQDKKYQTSKFREEIMSLVENFSAE